MKNKKIGNIAIGLFAAVAFSSVVLAADKGIDESVQSNDVPPINKFERARIILGPKVVRRNISVRQPRFVQIGSLHKVAIPISNDSDHIHTLEYKIEWCDEMGIPIDTSASWHRITLTERQQQILVSVGKRQDAKQILTTVRFPTD